MRASRKRESTIPTSEYWKGFIELNAQGRFPFEKLVKFYSLDQINQAAKDSENGSTVKPIIRLSQA